jgi:lauroyl/myristoyl acyltransferase
MQLAMKIIHVEGKEHLDSALRKGKGVIAFGAHFGNFVGFGTCLGPGWTPVSHTLSNPKRQTYAKAHCDVSLELPPIGDSSRPARSAVTRVLAALKRNKIVHILGDNLKERQD